MSKAEKAQAFMEKADRLLRWARSTQAEMREHGSAMRIDDVERVLWSLLLHISSMHEAIAATARLLGRSDWRENLNSERAKDPLLWYLWKARVAEAHHAVLQWSADVAHVAIRVVDREKALPIAKPWLNHPLHDWKGDRRRLLYAVYGATSQVELAAKIASGCQPDPALAAAAGVEIGDVYTGMSLKPFIYADEGRTIQVQAPGEHLGEFLPPSADEAIAQALKYYSRKLSELTGQPPRDTSLPTRTIARPADPA